jgi:CRP-like cAMP-binding protein
MIGPMAAKHSSARGAAAPFDVHAFFDSAGVERRVLRFSPGARIFAQGGQANAVFYIENGGVKLSVLSPGGKEAVVGMLGAGDFFGEGCLAGQPLRIGSATAVMKTIALRIQKTEMLRALHEHTAFAEHFLTHMLERNIRIEEDLVDQLFNSSEKSGSRERCSCWRSSARRPVPSGCCRSCRRKRSPRWSAPPGPA